MKSPGMPDREDGSIAQKQAGWSRLPMAYLSVSDDEVREAMREVEH
jgi:hypothetical protein